MIRQGRVGAPPHQVDTTYALVDVRNHSKHELEVALTGTLVTHGGEEISLLRSETLLIPPGALRMYALASDSAAPMGEGTRVVARVERSSRREHDVPIAIVDGNVYDDHGRLVVTGRALNRRRGRARVVVIAAFHDGKGIPVDRAFTTVDIDGGQAHPIRFVAPANAKKGQIYIGDYAY